MKRADGRSRCVCWPGPWQCLDSFRRHARLARSQNTKATSETCFANVSSCRVHGGEKQREGLPPTLWMVAVSEKPPEMAAVRSYKHSTRLNMATYSVLGTSKSTGRRGRIGPSAETNVDQMAPAPTFLPRGRVMNGDGWRVVRCGTLRVCRLLNLICHFSSNLRLRREPGANRVQHTSTAWASRMVRFHHVAIPFSTCHQSEKKCDADS